MTGNEAQTNEKSSTAVNKYRDRAGLNSRSDRRRKADTLSCKSNGFVGARFLRHHPSLTHLTAKMSKFFSAAIAGRNGQNSRPYLESLPVEFFRIESISSLTSIRFACTSSPRHSSPLRIVAVGVGSKAWIRHGSRSPLSRHGLSSNSNSKQ